MTPDAAAADANSFILYTKTGCPWCEDAVDYLREQGYAFEEIDVRRDPEGYAEMKRLSGQSLAPTLVVGDKVLPDFDVDELEEFLEENGLRRHRQA
ncbi:MAG: glutaredoxin family protein [Verrucomicrobia bacterium]|nr:glutaredoxin family protein [Verrucomicrobiota bacterium]MBV9659063.1 glutaredoxin family protein [Verrucomicrobiota bacterium]